MSFRHLAREIVIQALFAWDVRGKDETYKDISFEFSLDRFSGKIPDKQFPMDLYNGVIKKADVIDEIITRAAPQWPLDRIAPVDRNILRLGIYELLFSANNDVPPRVAINESIELAKTFGNKNSFKFVSGVLGSVFEASPQKAADDVQKQLEAEQEKDGVKKDEPAIIDKKVGSFIYTFAADGSTKVLFVNNVFGYWTLPKGSVDKEMASEEDYKKTLQEVMVEKLHAHIEVGEEIANNSYTSKDPQKGKITKEIRYYHAYCPSPDVVAVQAGYEGISDAKWFNIGDIKGLKVYPDMAAIFKKGSELTEAADIV